jgi:hypothetical protein
MFENFSRGEIQSDPTIAEYKNPLSKYFYYPAIKD